MIIATPSPERARHSAGAGAIPTQRNVSPTQSPPVAQAPITALEGASGAAPVPIVPASPTHVAPAGTARPTRVLPGRAGPLRRRWPAAVGGLAAGLTLGTVGAMGAVFALSATSPAWSARPSTAPTAAQASLSPNVSVPGRVLTAFGDGTWQVGVDIAAGTYLSAGAVDGAPCRHALRPARTGGAVTVGAEAARHSTVVLTEADGWFTTSGCATWQRIG